MVWVLLLPVMGWRMLSAPLTPAGTASGSEVPVPISLGPQAASRAARTQMTNRKRGECLIFHLGPTIRTGGVAGNRTGGWLLP